MENTTEKTAVAEDKQTVAQKVDTLQAEKTRLTSALNDMPEGADKTNAQERIATIDRKLRWYAGRSGEGKKAAAARPTKAKAPKAAKASKNSEKSSEPVASASSAANES